jgi:hypothetical protein
MENRKTAKPAALTPKQRMLNAFAGNLRVIVGTGDQVGDKSPEEIVRTLIDAVIRRQPC